MQKPTYFEHQMVLPSHLEFQSDSSEKATKDNFTAFTKGEPGILDGLTLGGVPLSSEFTVSAGVGYDGSGERLELYSGTGIGISFDGTKSIYASLGTILYDPENPLGSTNVITARNPDTGADVPIRQYNTVNINTTGTSNDIILGTITASSGVFVSYDDSTAQELKIAGILNINDGTIDGGIITSGTINPSNIDSSQSYDDGIILGTGSDITNLASGVNNLGTEDNPFSNIYAKTGTFHQINGNSPIIVDSLTQNTNTSLESTSGKVKIDNNGAGVQIGAELFTSGINTGGNTDLRLYTPSGNINITSASGVVNINSDISINNSSLRVDGLTTLTEGMIVTGDVDFTNANVQVTETILATKNTLYNSEFSIGYPTGTSDSDISNVGDQTLTETATLELLDAWDPVNASGLTPYRWGVSGTSGTVAIVGTSEDGSEEYRDSTVFTESPGLDYFVSLSGTGISVAEPLRFYTEITAAKATGTYNVSAYVKPVSDSSDYSFKAGIFEQPAATGNGTGFLSFDQTISSGSWVRLNNNITVSGSQRNSYLVMDIQPTGSSVDPTVKIAGVQTTKGDGLVSYQNNITDRTYRKNYLTPGVAGSNDNGWYPGAGTIGAYTTSTIITQTVYSKGSLATIKARSDIRQIRGMETGGWWQYFGCNVNLLIDGTAVDTNSMFEQYPNGLVSTTRQYDATNEFKTYLPKGTHEITVTVYASAPSNGAHYPGYVDVFSSMLNVEMID